MYPRMDLTSFLLGCVCILLHTIIPCDSMSMGASSLACVTLLPQHGAPPQQTSSPYTIRIQSSQAQYMPGGRVVVSLSVTSTSPGFKGFVLQARRVGQTTPLGTWENLPLGTKAMPCQGSSLDTATHTNSQPKTGVTLTWRAPSNDVGTIEFVASVVQSYSIFWGPIRSTRLTASQICIPNPCQNGGTCTALSISDYRCECRAGTEGNRCQTITQATNACSSGPCSNGGTCTVVGSSYRCSCVPGFTGTQCQTRAPVRNICSLNPCQNSATCTVTGTNMFRCTCRAGTTGPLCETIDSVCVSNPCLNRGQCSVVPGTTNYQCSCSVEFSGSRCQNTQCSSSPCLNGAQCTVITGTSGYRCICTPGYDGTNCQNSVCTSNPCLNGGQCSIVPGTNNYQCSCSISFSGSRCQTTPCSSSPCLNGAQCTVITGTSGYRCICTPGYDGTNCQNSVCTSNPCLNRGQCSIVPGTNNYQCSCSVGFSGSRCQTTPCSSSPCLNGAQCTVITGTSGYRCICTPGYDGTNCQISTSTSRCVPNPCFNDGQCITVTGGVGYRCNCRSGYSGFNCAQSLNPCLPNPCLNGGSCSTPSTSTFACQCADGWSGANCATQSQAVCASSNFCQNGGTCLPNPGGSFTCRCAEGFNGVDCSNMISPCFPNPCLNGGSCTVSGNLSFRCTCLATHSGVTCQVPDLCSPSPCRNGVCQQTAGAPSYTCTCNPGYTGAICDVQALCNPNPCVNGVCSQDGVSLNYSCQCNVGFMGRNCDQTRQAPCVTNPCMNGLCLVLGDGISYECACQAGYRGTHCEEAVNPIFQNCPQFQILTYPLLLNQRSANVTVRLTAIVPGAAPVTVEVTTGPEIPGIVPYTEEYRLGKEMVVKATSAAGTTTECQFLIRMTDEEPPSVTCPQDITKVTYGSSMAVIWPSATATDNLAASSDINIEYSMENGSFFPADEEAMPSTVNVTAKDTFGNVASCKFQVTVVKIPNAPTPVFSGCRDGETVSYQLRNNTDIAYVSMNVQARDSSLQPAIISQLEGPEITLPGDVKFTEVYRQGEKFVFRALDPVTELTADCTFWIKMVDKQPPQMKCPPNIIERTTADQKVIFWPLVDVQDNLPLPDGNTIRFDRNNGTVFDAMANGLSHIVTVTATDSFDNVGACQFSVTLYKFDIVCSEFPPIANSSSDCVIAADGKMECRVSCDQGYEYSPDDNRFKCQISSTSAFWEPAPNANACSRPTAGNAISKTVTAVFPFNAQVCDASNRVFVSNIQASIQSSLRDANLCERGVARACESNSVVPKCGVVAGGANKRKRRAFTDLSVEIKVTGPTQGASLSEVKQDVDDLADRIKDLADGKLLFLIINFQTVSSLSSSVSTEYSWSCPEGFKSTPGGCVSCPSGTYFNSSRQECMFCERGYYQQASGQISCIQCGTGESTLQVGSGSVRQCQSETEAITSVWSPILISVVAISIALILILILGLLCICLCMPTAEDRQYSRDKDGSLSNLKYLNKAYEDQYRKRRSVVGVHRLGKRQTSPSRASTATGYITMSSGGRSGSQNHVDMVSIDSDDYRDDVHSRRGHFNHGNDIVGDVGVSYGHVSTATLANNRGRFSSPANQQVSSDTQMRRELPDTGL